MLYIVDNNQTSLKILNITSNNPWGIIKVPTFKINETNENEFIRLVQTTDSPFVEFISKHYFATMQTKMIRNQVLPMLNVLLMIHYCIEIMFDIEAMKYMV
ncbi:hypothetical protein C6B38_07990 [Spiroplasma sp. ChiS]|nr:hypothetical protein C6B38_07990 [Spiroplasma sp. ChiS]